MKHYIKTPYRLRYLIFFAGLCCETPLFISGIVMYAPTAQQIALSVVEGVIAVIVGAFFGSCNSFSKSFVIIKGGHMTKKQREKGQFNRGSKGFATVTLLLLASLLLLTAMSVYAHLMGKYNTLCYIFPAALAGYSLTALKQNS